MTQTQENCNNTAVQINRDWIRFLGKHMSMTKKIFFWISIGLFFFLAGAGIFLISYVVKTYFL